MTLRPSHPAASLGARMDAVAPSYQRRLFVLFVILFILLLLLIFPSRSNLQTWHHALCRTLHLLLTSGPCVPMYCLAWCGS